MRETPRFKHDCDRCRFLGRWRGKVYEESETEQDYDLYVCQSTGKEPYSRGPVFLDSWLARYSDDGSEYISGSPPRQDTKFYCPPWMMAVWMRLDG